MTDQEQEYRVLNEWVEEGEEFNPVQMQECWDAEEEEYAFYEEHSPRVSDFL